MCLQGLFKWILLRLSQKAIITLEKFFLCLIPIDIYVERLVGKIRKCLPKHNFPTFFSGKFK